MSEIRNEEEERDLGEEVRNIPIIRSASLSSVELVKSMWPVLVLHIDDVAASSPSNLINLRLIWAVASTR